MKFFTYGQEEMEYLRKKDRKLAEVIDVLGFIERPVTDDLFESLVDSILGQQISTKAHQTIRTRMFTDLKKINADTILTAGKEKLQSYGLSFRKAEYILNLAQCVKDGVIDLESLCEKSDEEVIRELSSLNGVGVWTAEMIMLHCMQRTDILSYGDLGILKGMRMVYHHRKIDKKLFEKYKRRYSPYGSIASIYFWAVSAGAIEGMKDYVPKKKK